MEDYDLKGSDMEGSDMKGSDVGGSDVEYSDVEGSDMEYSDMEGAGCSTCQGIVLELVKDMSSNEDAEPVEAPDSDTDPTEEDKPDYAAAPIELLWPNGKVFQVWILNTTNKAKFKDHINLVKEGVREWEKYANVSFTFPTDWDMNSPPEVRLRFWDKPPGFIPEKPDHNISDGCWSYVGNTCEGIAEMDRDANFWNPTMSLRRADLSRPESLKSFKATILHEFGHMLGFMHEHQRPDGELEVNYNLDEVYKHYKGQGWNRAKVNEQVLDFHEYRDKSAIAGTKFDTTSIMMYDIPAKLLKDKTKAVSKNYYLSKLDKEFVARLYPKGVKERSDFQPREIIPDHLEIKGCLYPSL